MAFPTTGILDDFDRPDETPLDGGGNWGDRNAAGDLNLRSNQVQGNLGSTNLNSRYWTPSTFGPDCEAYVTVTTLGIGSDYLRLWLRIQNPGDAGETGYMMQWSNDATGCRIFKETARETYSQLAQNASPDIVVGDVVGFEAIGTALTVYRNGSVILTTTDATTGSAGNIALGCRSNQFFLDDFGGGTIAAGEAFWITTL